MVRGWIYAYLFIRKYLYISYLHLNFTLSQSSRTRYTLNRETKSQTNDKRRQSRTRHP